MARFMTVVQELGSWRVTGTPVLLGCPVDTAKRLCEDMSEPYSFKSHVKMPKRNTEHISKCLFVYELF
jgi:hypothetical protein